MALLEGSVGPSLLRAEVRTGNLGEGLACPALAQAEIAFGQPDPAQVADCERLRWIHLTSAGYTRYETPEFFDLLRARGIALTNSSGIFAEPCAQHLLAFLLAAIRQVPAAIRATPEWRTMELRPAARILDGQTILILGYGEIGACLARMLAPFSVQAVGFRRTPTGQEAIPVYPISEFDAWLPRADAVLSAMPLNPASRGHMNAERFGRLKPGAIFANVGRGGTVDQDALLEALRSGRVAQALLDVTDPEPLPANHPLWREPRCTITPHIAGGLQEEDLTLVRWFLQNYGRYRSGRPLAGRVV